jgi:hypothetical protein
MKALNTVKYLFIAFGLVMLAGALFWYLNTKSFIKAAASAQGTVVELIPVRSDGSTTYKPLVRFTTAKGGAIEFSSSSSSNPPGYEVGETVEVYYLEGSPRDAKVSGFFSLWGGAVIVGGMGLVFFAIGGGILLVTMLKGRSRGRLKLSGTPIETDFIAVELNTSLEVNGRNPFCVVTQWQNPATSKVHVFRSKNLWFDPTSFIKAKRITVFIDANNPKKYYVDLSFLPEMAE